MSTTNMYLCVLILALSTTLSSCCTLFSPAFENNTFIPVKYTQDGENISPALHWHSHPDHAKYVALLLTDPDAAGAPNHLAIHWIFYDVPIDLFYLPDGVAIGSAAYPGLNGRNIAGQNKYVGPAPPRGDDAHHYEFALYALTDKTGLGEGATYEEVLTAIKPFAVDACDLLGLYKR